MQLGETSFEFGVAARRRKSPAYGGTDHGPWPDSPRAGNRHSNPVAAMERATAMESAASTGNPLRRRSGSHNFPQPRRRVGQERCTCRAGSGYLVKAILQPAVVHRPSGDRLGIRLACLDQGPGRSGKGTGPIVDAWATVFRPGDSFSGKSERISMAGP